MSDTIIAQNPVLGEVEVELIEMRRGEWTYELIRVGDKMVCNRADAEGRPKKEMRVRARYFARNCQYIPGIGYCLTSTLGEDDGDSR